MGNDEAEEEELNGSFLKLMDSRSPASFRTNRQDAGATLHRVQGVTVNVALLLADPPGVVTAIVPDFAPAGTVAAICVPELNA